MSISLSTTKQIATIVVGFSTSGIIKGIIKNNVATETAFEKANVLVGSLVLGGIVADASKTYVETKIDKLALAWHNRENINVTTI